MKPPFRKILIANRGEIGLRVLRAARELGISTVAIYSDADADSLLVRLADEALPLGGREARESYLVSEKILALAAQSKADAIHPGFGFLSENAAFARSCREAGITFIGPTPEAIDLMGDKLRARATMKAAGVPTVPGSEGALSHLAQAEALAQAIGFPVILKASAGGGGKGMRVAHSLGELRSIYDSVKREALNYFKDDSVFLERYAKDPHHIEVQIIADHHGNVCHLLERECSVQRRHQKVIEEAPSPFLDGHQKVRDELYSVAVAGAKRIGYRNAGTMEFVMDGDRNFYFLEMNTRIQVEHPISEMITGIDIVKEQIRIAAGEPLSFSQEEIKPLGAAIECRLYAEDPVEFLPRPGPVHSLQLPGGPFVRVEAALAAGQRVPVEYDPMIAKICASGRNRPEAIARMERALRETFVGGCLTNISFLRRCLAHPTFKSGSYTTGLIAQEKASLCQSLPPDLSYEDLCRLLAAAASAEELSLNPGIEATWWRAP
jgi:acetyl-CoA carboxylase, biotin carboxylase subunit